MNANILVVLLLLGNFEFAGAMLPSPRGHPHQKVERVKHSKFSVAKYIMEAIPEKNKELIKELSDYAVNYCHTAGLVGLWEEPPKPSDLAIVWSIGLLPSPFPAELFHQAMETQEYVNELYFRVTLDHEFLIAAYEDMLDTNEWIKKQVELMKKVRNKIRQHKTLIFNRADYLTHQVKKGDPITLKQVEVGIGQLGGPGLGQRMSKVHRQMLDKIELLQYGNLPTMANGKWTENKLSIKMSEAMLEAWKSFSDEFDDPKAVIVFLFDEQIITIASFEQRQFMQFDLERLAKERGQYANVVLVTIPESPERIRLDENDGHLYVDGDKRVGLVHMSVGLLPKHWKTEEEWETRSKMERSNAIISPNIRAQLAGTKRIQQLLAMPNVLERFFNPNTEGHKIEAIKETFVKLWGLEKDDEKTKKVLAEVDENPENYVLKEQLGAGKGNHFGEDINKMLNKMTIKERSAYTLMEKIRPISVKNYMRRPFHPEATLHDVNSELSIFGTYLGKGEFDVKIRGSNRSKHETIFNRTEGYLVRSKHTSSDQGGLTNGSGFLDSLLLFPEKDFRKIH